MGNYSHLSNKRGITLIDFEKKIYPPRTLPTFTFIDFLDFFPPSMFIRTYKVIREMRVMLAR